VRARRMDRPVRAPSVRVARAVPVLAVQRSAPPTPRPERPRLGPARSPRGFSTVKSRSKAGAIRRRLERIKATVSRRGLVIGVDFPR
jgi:hypothetical protein